MKPHEASNGHVLLIRLTVNFTLLQDQCDGHLEFDFDLILNVQMNTETISCTHKNEAGSPNERLHRGNTLNQIILYRN